MSRATNTINQNNLLINFIFCRNKKINDYNTIIISICFILSIKTNE